MECLCRRKCLRQVHDSEGHRADPVRPDRWTPTHRWDSKHDRFKPGGAPPASGFEAGLVWKRENTDEQAVLKEWEFRNAQRTRIQSANRGPWNPNAGAWFA